jgi:ABC-type sugar transport system ATPase subunit
MNFFPNVTIARVAGSFKAIIDDQTVSLSQQVAEVMKDHEGMTVTLGIRPEDLTVTTDRDQAVLHGTIDLIEQLENSFILYVDIGTSMILASADLRSRQKVGETVGLAIKDHKLHAFDPETAEALF